LKELGLLSIVLLIALPVANAQTVSTFNDCYAQTTQGLIMMSIFTPTKISFTDPRVKDTIINFCNFYHEKTGKWITSDDWGDVGMYGQEFYNEYHNTMPESFTNLMASFGSIIK
jgi:hypothetical protein